MSSETPNPSYLWAVGDAVYSMRPGQLIGNRYRVINHQLWADTQPDLLPYAPEELTDQAVNYLQLYPYYLHLPEVYGFCSVSQSLAGSAAPQDSLVLLLTNIPVDPQGNLYPSLSQAWPSAPALHQVYWLWQLLQLWQPLADRGLARSLLIPDNLRVQGWRVRLCELIPNRSVTDPNPLPANLAKSYSASSSLAVNPQAVEGPVAIADSQPLPASPTLHELGQLWLSWCSAVPGKLAGSLVTLCRQMGQVPLATTQAELNSLMLRQAANLPITLTLAGLSDVGPQRTHNEDTCFPDQIDLQTTPPDSLLPFFGIICDGIGGHDGGEVASQLALNSLKIQVKALLDEVAAASEPIPPTAIAEHLAAAIRVTNNLIASQNDGQGRELRQRMGTTLVMALVIPQRINLDSEQTNSDQTPQKYAHELYLAHVGDSRAYWITQNYCHRLTLDDDVATRDVRLGYSLYWEALRRSDGGILTQAIGTRDAEFLHPTIQRFLLVEEGLLLLCSDGLSDNDQVEQSWPQLAEPILKGWVSLPDAVQQWVDIANQNNGYDNTSVVLMRCNVSSTRPSSPDPIAQNGSITPPVNLPTFGNPVPRLENAPLSSRTDFGAALPQTHVPDPKMDFDFSPAFLEESRLPDTPSPIAATQPSYSELSDPDEPSPIQLPVIEARLEPNLDLPQDFATPTLNPAPSNQRASSRQAKTSRSPFAVIAIVTLTFLALGTSSMLLWARFDPTGFQQLRDRLNSN